MAGGANRPRPTLRKQLNGASNLAQNSNREIYMLKHWWNELNCTSDSCLGLKNALVNSIKYGAGIVLHTLSYRLFISFVAFVTVVHNAEAVGTPYDHHSYTELNSPTCLRGVVKFWRQSKDARLYCLSYSKSVCGFIFFRKIPNAFLLRWESIGFWGSDHLAT